MTIPLHFQGGDEAPGVKQEAGIVTHTLNELEIKCLPSDLPEFIDVDISQLALGESLHLTDIKLPKGVELATAVEDETHNHMVVGIQTPKASSEPEETVTSEGESEQGTQTDESKPADSNT